MDGVLDGDVAVQRDGVEVYDGGRGEEYIQVNLDGVEFVGQRLSVIYDGENVEG